MRRLGRAARLLDQHLELAEFEQEIAERQPGRPRRQDRRLEHRVLARLNPKKSRWRPWAMVSATIRVRSSRSSSSITRNS